jgi:hypothetical protein
MRIFAVFATLTVLAVFPLAGASDEQTIHGSFVTAVPFALLAPNPNTNGIVGFAFPAPAAGSHIKVHVDSATTPVYDVDVHYFNAAGTHVDSKPDLCDTPTQNVDQECDVPDIGATTVVVDAKYGGNVAFTVTITPPPAV